MSEVPRYWTSREPDETVADWVTRLAICYSVAKQAAGPPAVIPWAFTSLILPGSYQEETWAPARPRGCGEYHAGECTSELSYTARRAQ